MGSTPIPGTTDQRVRSRLHIRRSERYGRFVIELLEWVLLALPTDVSNQRDD